jgi:hypothetical protein
MISGYVFAGRQVPAGNPDSQRFAGPRIAMSDPADEGRLLYRVIVLLHPYARSSGPFNNVQNLETAIGLARFYLSCAERLIDRLP